MQWGPPWPGSFRSARTFSRTSPRKTTCSRERPHRKKSRGGVYPRPFANHPRRGGVHPRPSEEGGRKALPYEEYRQPNVGAGFIPAHPKREGIKPSPTSRGDRSEPKRLDRRQNRRRVLLPDGRVGVHVELDLVAVRIGQIEALAHGVVAHAGDRHPGLFQFDLGLAELIQGIPDFDPDVVEPEAAATGRTGGLADLDQQQFMVSTA